MEEDSSHVMEDRIQSLVRGIVGELFVSDSPGKISNLVPLATVTEDDHEINHRFRLPRTRADNNNAIHANSPSPLTLLLLHRLHVVFAGRIHALAWANSNSIFISLFTGFFSSKVILQTE